MNSPLLCVCSFFSYEDGPQEGTGRMRGQNERGRGRAEQPPKIQVSPFPSPQQILTYQTHLYESCCFDFESTQNKASSLPKIFLSKIFLIFFALKTQLGESSCYIWSITLMSVCQCMSTLKNILKSVVYGGYNTWERRFKTVLDSPLQSRCLQQIASSCNNNLKL